MLSNFSHWINHFRLFISCITWESLSLFCRELGPVPTNSVTVKAPAMPASVVAPSVPASVSAPTIPTTVTASLEPGHQVEMRLVDVVSPCQFWAVLVKNASELVNLGKQLDAHYKQMPPNTVYRWDIVFCWSVSCIVSVYCLPLASFPWQVFLKSHLACTWCIVMQDGHSPGN